MRVSDVLVNLQKSGGSADSAVMMESVCRGDLRRPLHCKEFLLPAILKWANWSEDDRKDNQLVFGRHPVIDQLVANDKVVRVNIFTKQNNTHICQPFVESADKVHV